MKKTITKLALTLGLTVNLSSQAQVVSFDTFTLSPNSYYQDNAGTDFSSNGVTFQYAWNPSFGGYWESGTAYTNKLDTIDGSYTNLYGAIPGLAFSGNNYAAVQSGAIIAFSNTTTAVTGFYVTNSTFAWKVIKKGNQFARRFGDTTGTGSGASITQGEFPDWYKLLVRGYRGGNMLTDSVEFYLADYRADGTTNDYVVKNWQFVNCSSLGQVDSISLNLKSSDNSFGFMNTPSFFSMDNFTTQSTVGVNELNSTLSISLFPNPTSQNISLMYESSYRKDISVTIFDISGKQILYQLFETNRGKNQTVLNTEKFEAGVYLVELSDETSTKKIKFIKL